MSKFGQLYKSTHLFSQFLLFCTLPFLQSPCSINFILYFHLWQFQCIGKVHLYSSGNNVNYQSYKWFPFSTHANCLLQAQLIFPPCRYGDRLRDSTRSTLFLKLGFVSLPQALQAKCLTATPPNRGSFMNFSVKRAYTCISLKACPTYHQTKLIWLLAYTELPSFLLVDALSALASFLYTGVERYNKTKKV